MNPTEIENPNLENPNNDPIETLEKIPHKKHTAMLKHLSKTPQSRLHSSSSSSPSFESLPSFLNQFSDLKLSIQSHLLAISPSDPNSISLINLNLQNISHLQNLLSDHSYFLPPYEIRSSLKTIQDLNKLADSARAKIAPRKKFAFKNKGLLKKEPAAGEIEERVESDVVRFFDSPGFRDRRGGILVKRFGGLDCEGDFSIVDLDSCDVYLIGRFRALFVHRVKNCRVFSGPVMGSVLVEEVEGCLFMVASHQIRIHGARECDFYLRVRSRPIVEGCGGVRFAPYRLVYEGVEKDLGDSGLGEENGNWGNVDDFLWLRAVQSPNWCLVPEEEYVGVRDVSELEEKADEK